MNPNDTDLRTLLIRTKLANKDTVRLAETEIMRLEAQLKLKHVGNQAATIRRFKRTTGDFVQGQNLRNLMSVNRI